METIFKTSSFLIFKDQDSYILYDHILHFRQRFEYLSQLRSELISDIEHLGFDEVRMGIDALYAYGHKTIKTVFRSLSLWIFVDRKIHFLSAHPYSFGVCVSDFNELRDELTHLYDITGSGHVLEAIDIVDSYNKKNQSGVKS